MKAAGVAAAHKVQTQGVLAPAVGPAAGPTVGPAVARAVGPAVRRVAATADDVHQVLHRVIKKEDVNFFSFVLYDVYVFFFLVPCV